MWVCVCFLCFVFFPCLWIFFFWWGHRVGLCASVCLCWCVSCLCWFFLYLIKKRGMSERMSPRVMMVLGLGSARPTNMHTAHDFCMSSGFDCARLALPPLSWARVASIYMCVHTMMWMLLVSAEHKTDSLARLFVPWFLLHKKRRIFKSRPWGESSRGFPMTNTVITIATNKGKKVEQVRFQVFFEQISKALAECDVYTHRHIRHSTQQLWLVSFQSLV